MGKKGIVLFFTMLMVLVILGLLQAAPGITPEDAKQIMPVSQVKIGMKGYGLTVFKGTKIEKFQFEVLGVLKKVNTGKDLILVKLSGGPITERGANIIQGMSGSPCFINGKMVGAVAYGNSYPKEPIGMLTPIEDMLESLDPNLPSKPSSISTGASAEIAPVTINGATYNRLEIKNPSWNGTPPNGTLIMKPLMTPMMVSGMNARGIAKLAEILEPLGISVMASPGGKPDPTMQSPPMTPGAALAVSLATGDIDITGTGTLTYRRGNKIVAFGHPMSGVGPIDLPMSSAYIFDVFPGINVSFKISSPIKPVGHTFQDRPWSVGGELGKPAKMIPVTIYIDDVAIARKKTLHINVANHPLYTRRLIGLVAAQAIADSHGVLDDTMATVRTEVEADEVGKIIRENIVFDPVYIEDSATEDLAGIVNILCNNRFHPVNIKSVTLSVKIESGRQTANIERIFVDKLKYEPGDTVNLGVELKPYKGDKIFKTIQIKVPKDAPDGKFTLQVRGGAAAATSAPTGIIIIGGQPGQQPGGPSTSSATAENVRQLIDKFLEQPKNNELVAKITLPSPAVTISGQKLEGLPDAIAAVMKSPRSSVFKAEPVEIKSTIPVDYVVSGSQNISINVSRRRLAEKKPSPAPSEQPSQPPTSDSAQAMADVEYDYDEMILGWNSSEEASITNLGSDSLNLASQNPTDQKPDARKPQQSPTPTKAETTGEKPTVQPPSPTEQKTAEKTVCRQPQTWKQAGAQQFALGVFDCTSATTADDIRPVPAVVKLAALPESFAWAVVHNGQGDVLVGTGNSGLIYRITQNGSYSVFFKTGELEVHSLAVDSKGNVYAGTSPNGKVFRIQPNGNGEVVFDAPERYITALATDDKDNIYAGTGDAGVIYQITPDGKCSVLTRLPENSVMCLAVGRSGIIYAGTARSGSVYKIDPNNSTVETILSTAEDSVTSIAVTSDDTVYAGAGTSRSNIYKITPAGVSKTIYDKASYVLSMARDTSNNVYAISDESILKIAPDDTVMQLDTKRAGVQFTAITVDDNGNIFAGTSNTAAVYKSEWSNNQTYESVVHDAGLPAKWGTVSYIADVPEGTSVQIWTRSGNSAEPNDTWSIWTPVGLEGAVSSPKSRYIQYRIVFSGQTNAQPKVKQISLSFLTDNRAPKINITEPQPGTIAARTTIIRWSGSDPDNDQLTYELFCSSDEGKTWQPLGSVVKPTANNKNSEQPKIENSRGSNGETTTQKPKADELLNQLNDELDKNSEIPDDVKQKMKEAAPAAIEKTVEAASKPAEEPKSSETPSGTNTTTKQTSFNWDTTKVPDGKYLIKVVASDRISNAVDYLTEEKTVGPIVVANKPPKITIAKKETKVSKDGTVTIEGLATDEQVAIVGVQFKIDNGEWMAAAASDGMFDSSVEAFTATTGTLGKGKHTIEIKAINAAGSSVSEKVTVE